MTKMGPSDAFGPFYLQTLDWTHEALGSLRFTFCDAFDPIFSTYFVSFALNILLFIAFVPILILIIT